MNDSYDDDRRLWPFGPRTTTALALLAFVAAVWAVWWVLVVRP